MCKSQVVVIWLNAFIGFSDGAVEVHSLGYCTVAIQYLLRGILCEWTTRTQITSSFETEDIIQEELFFNLGRVLAIKIMLERHQTPQKLVI